MSLNTPISLPNTFSLDEVFLFLSFSFFFFLNFVRSSSPKPQNTEINFFVKLLSCKRTFVSRNFFWPLPRKPTQSQFFELLKLGRQFFLY